MIDNTFSHYNPDLAAMCYEADILFVYLPPYSLDFNPIKTSFSILKHWIRQHSSLIIFYIKKTGRFACFLYDVVRKLLNNIEHNSGNLFRLSGIQYP